MSSNSIGVIASAPTPYLRWLLADLGALGIPARWVFLGSVAERRLFALRSLTRVRRRQGWVEVMSRLLDRRLLEPPRSQEVPSFASLQHDEDFEVVEYDDVNGGRLLVDVMQRGPALLLLAGCGMVEPSLLKMPSLGVLNCHPALLPGARGVDTLEWSLIDNLPLGVTAHFAVPAVDAGAIILKRELTPSVGESLPEFRQRLLRTQAQCLAASASLVLSGEYTPQKHDLSRSTLFYASRRADRRLAEAKFALLTKS